MSTQAALLPQYPQFLVCVKFTTNAALMNKLDSKRRHLNAAWCEVTATPKATQSEGPVYAFSMKGQCLSTQKSASANKAQGIVFIVT